MKPQPSKAATRAAAPSVKHNAPESAKEAVASKPLPEAKAKAAEASPPRPLEDSRHDRACRDLGRIVDDLVSIIRAELDTDRLQGSARNALTHTVERLIAAKSNL